MSFPAKAHITFGDKELICSASFLTFGLGETRLEIEYNSDHLTLIFNFVETDDKEKKPYTNWENIANDEARLTLTNFVSPFEAGWKEPIKLGSLANRPIFLIWTAKAHVGGIHHVTFSVYLGAAEARPAEARPAEARPAEAH